MLTILRYKMCSFFLGRVITSVTYRFHLNAYWLKVTWTERIKMVLVEGAWCKSLPQSMRNWHYISYTWNSTTAGENLGLCGGVCAVSS